MPVPLITLSFLNKFLKINFYRNIVALWCISFLFCCSVTKSYPMLCDPMHSSTPGFPVLGYLPELLKLMSIDSVMPSNHLIVCRLQFSSVTQSCLTLCSPMDCSPPGFPVHHQCLESPQTHVHQVSDAIQPSHPLSSPSPPALNLSQHQGLFKWVSSLHQVAQVLELQHQSFQWIFRTDFL